MSVRASRACAVAFVVLAAVYVAWQGWHYQSMGDYPADYAPAMNALLGGHFGAFFMHLPTNGAGGSVLLRAPAALLGKLLVGTQLAEFRLGALVCVLAAGALGMWLTAQMGEHGLPLHWRAGCLAACVLCALVLDAIFYGHPEEPLGAVLCVCAVLLAADGSSRLAGITLGLAMINKPWGVLAVAPALLAAKQGQLRIVLSAAVICGGWTLAAYVVDPAHFSRIVLGASTSVVAHPVDLFWPLARRHVAPGVETAYFPPKFVSAHARELAVALTLPLSLWMLRRGERSLDRCLALLALLFLLRCMLDPSNHVYYQVPVIIALASWEALSRRPPVLSLGAMAGFFLVFHTVSGTGSLTAQFVAYIAITLPLAATLLGAAGMVQRRDRRGGSRRLSLQPAS